MDQNLPPPAPSTTAPSDQGEHISNLSTRPNLYEQNDSYDARVIDHSHHSQSIHFGRENHRVQQNTENQSSNHSQNYNKAHSQPLIDNSNFPNLNQSVSQLLPSQNSNNNKIQAERKLELTTFDENWQSDLKQQQANRQQYHQLFHENNELLLTQKADEFNFSGNTSLQSELLVDQDKRSDVSNEVMINQIISKAPEIIYEESSHGSNSVKDQPINPLFQNAVKDESQSNLLEFGFSRQSKRPDHTWTIKPEPIIFQPAHQSSNSIRITNNNDSSVSSFNETENRFTSIQRFSTISQIGYKEPQRPMIIEETVQNSQSKHSYKYQPQHSSNQSSKHSNQMIKIEVHNCKEEVIDSYTKNNDIYGISPKKQGIIVQKQSQHIWEHQEYQAQNAAQEDINPNKQTEHEQVQIVFKEQQKQNYPLSQTFEQHHKEQQRDWPQQTTEGVMQEISNILSSSISQQEKAHAGGKILQKHINLFFLSPLTDIGKQILQDGKHSVVLMDLILMKETDNVTKNLLRKYLQLTFASKINKGQNKLLQYQHSTMSISIVQPEPEPQQKAKINQHQSYANQTTHDTFNQSVHAEHGSIGKDSNEKMIIDNQKQPIKRTRVTRQPVSLISQKPTRKTRLKTKGKGKGKTTAKKSAVKFETDSNHSHVDVKQQALEHSQIERKQQKSPFKKSRQSQRLMNDSINKNDNNELGSKYTFILRENLKSENKQLLQLRKSQRIAKNNSQGKQKSNSRTRGPKKSPHNKIQRLSGNKIYQQQQIDINFLKNNIKEIKVKNVTMPSQLDALTPLDENILQLLNDYEKEISIQKRQIPEQTHELTAQDNGQYSRNLVNNSYQVTKSNSESVPNTRKQFKEKLAKYKIPSKAVIISKIIDPNINNHGIYALLQLSPISQIWYSAKYALTPITNLSRASKKLIDQDIKRALEITKDELDNFAFIQPSETILNQIKNQSQKNLKRK